MSETTNLEVVTPSAIIVSEPVEMVVIPGSDGQIGALPRHSKVISNLDRGLVDIFNDNKVSSQIMIDGGIAEINETTVTILAERAEKIDKANKQVLEEKLLAYQSQENHDDQNVAEVFTGSPGVLVPLEDTIKGFKGIADGEYDDLPEASFYMVGTIEEAIEKAKKLAKDAA